MENQLSECLQRRALLRGGWPIDRTDDAPPPPHGWQQCVCARDEVAALACKCACHGVKPRPFAKRRRWTPGQVYACVIDFTTRERKSPGELNKERKARIASRRQPRLF